MPKNSMFHNLVKLFLLLICSCVFVCKNTHVSKVLSIINLIGMNWVLIGRWVLMEVMTISRFNPPRGGTQSKLPFCPPNFEHVVHIGVPACVEPGIWINFYLPDVTFQSGLKFNK